METCRTCARCDFENENNWLDLFHPWMEEIAHVRNELSIWRVKVSPNDGLPQKICTDCFSKFCDVYTFRVACQQAQVQLVQLFEKIEGIDNDDESLAAAAELESHVCTDNALPMGKSNEDTLMNFFEISNDENDANEVECATNDQEVEEEVSVAIATTTITITPQTATVTTTIATTNTAEHNNYNDRLSVEKPLDGIGNDSTDTFGVDDATNGNTMEDLIEVVNDEVDIGTYQSEPIDELISLNDNQHMLDEVSKSTQESMETVSNEVSTTIELTFECKYCYKSKETKVQQFTQQELLNHITNKHDPELPFTCPNCEQGFRDAASRTVHIKDKHVEKRHGCDVCGKKYADRSNLRHHIEKYHSENDFECTLCEKRFYSRKSLKYHMKWHDPERLLKCNHCERLFINQRHLKCHEATHTGLRNCEYCSFCGKSFIHLKTLRWHIFRKHGGEKPYKCSHCSEAFTSYREKRIHMLEFHLENLTTIERSECMLCHKHFDDEDELKSHMTDDHIPKKPILIIANNKRVLQNKRKKSFSGVFQCDVCSQRFNMKSALDRHVNVHSVEGRPHACPQCPKRFKRIQDMNWHMKTHSNEKTNICDVCGKGFALKYVLTQHKRSHEVLEKNFTCEICGRSYLFEKTLRVHERVHTGKTYYKCDLCSESFVTHIKFKYHMRKKHSSLENEELPLDELVNIVIPGN